MATIDHDQVKHIAHLSRLELTDQEVTLYTDQLGKILDHASQLPECEEQSESLARMRMEDDNAEPRHNSLALLQNAVAVEDGFVKVPAILDKGDSGA